MSFGGISSSLFSFIELKKAITLTLVHGINQKKEDVPYETCDSRETLGFDGFI